MRHVVGFVVGLALAPVAMLATGWTLPRLAREAAGSGAFPATGGVVTVGVLAAVALLLGLALVPPRLTPLLPGVAGLTLVGATVTALIRPDLLERVPASLPGAEGALALLAAGAYLVPAFALVLPLFVGSRWVGRRTERPVTEEEYFDGLYDEDYEESDRSPAPAPAAAPDHRAG
ncbi:hypothetical protein [Nocardiopsis trehalosi]|uniref:hypothetical protein n=1 Tax=Nocardiopsis trehalosi TaxID=109329 RepID=UPI00082E0355|nr:hypothetical protein [Nocardiopsis trehalosi]